MKDYERPPFATGFIVDDYRPLFEYWRAARERGLEDLVEKSMPSDSDINLLLEKIRGEKLSLGDVIEMAMDLFITRIDSKLALEAVRRAGYERIGEKDAHRMIARILAGWLIELLESSGKLRFTSGGRPGNQ